MRVIELFLGALLMNHVEPRADKYVYARELFVAILAYDGFVRYL